MKKRKVVGGGLIGLVAVIAAQAQDDSEIAKL